MRNFETAAVIGTGAMGPGIAMILGLGGLRSTILSRTEEGARKGLAAAYQQLHLLQQNGLATAAQAAWVLENLSASTDMDRTVAAADLVIESTPENMQCKQLLFLRLDSIARPQTVLASNTSGLSITAIASGCKRPDRVLTTHFWNPPHLMPLVEIVKSDKTAEKVALSIRDLLIRCGKVPVVIKKDCPGQLGNRLQMALLREAINIVQEGIADVEDVDLAAKAGF